MNRETKLDIIELSRAYLGVFLLSWWGFWNILTDEIIFSDLTGFVSTLGGLL